MKYSVKIHVCAVCLYAITLSAIGEAQTDRVSDKAHLRPKPGQVPPLPPRLPAGIPAYSGNYSQCKPD